MGQGRDGSKPNRPTSATGPGEDLYTAEDWNVAGMRPRVPSMRFIIIHVPKDQLTADGGQWTDVDLAPLTSAALVRGPIVNHSFSIDPSTGDGYITVLLAS